MPPELTVWDFDGVLNANLVNGRPVWADHMMADLGVDPGALKAFLFGSGHFKRIVRGQDDLRDVLAQWLADTGQPIGADALLDYWFTRDAHPDPETTGWLKAQNGRKVIGTNNERRRAGYIADRMGYGALVERIFASGEMGVAKPDPGFFAAIERAARVPPQRILLIDDTAANVAAACARGWQGVHFSDATRSTLPARLGL